MSEYDVFLADCPARTTLGLVSDTWSVVVIFGLGQYGKQRYSDLLRRTGGISKKMLTQTLRRLASNGLVDRRTTAGPPAGVEYELTSLGRSLLVPISALAAWAESHTDELLTYRGEH